MSKSEAWADIVGGNRVTFGYELFLPLVDLDGSKTTAFEKIAPGSTQDENKEHHPYFLDQIGILVDDAIKFDLPVQQQLLWTKSGKWLELDGSIPHQGAEPDFATIQHRVGEAHVSHKKDGVTTPRSKYEVSAVFEQKKLFTDTDQIEAIDYAQRLLCIQSERSTAIAALLHCCEHEKTIRWYQVTQTHDQDRFITKVSNPAPLTPGGMGQRQLLSFFCTASLQLGLENPKVVPDDGRICEVFDWLGTGATSKVYRASLGRPFSGEERIGVAKILKDGFAAYTDRESSVLTQLKGVSGVPVGEKMCTNVLFFDTVLLPVQDFSRDSLEQLLSCLRAAHENAVVHRDVRPENVMKDVRGQVVLNDWVSSDGTTTVTPG